MRKREADPEANAEYARKYRAEHPDAYERIKAMNRAQRRTHHRLVALHRDDYERILNEERAKEGLPPLGSLKVGRPAKRKRDGA